jgi:hypothetical protein
MKYLIQEMLDNMYAQTLLKRNIIMQQQGERGPNAMFLLFSAFTKVDKKHVE